MPKFRGKFNTALIFLSLAIILNTAIYYAYGITKLTSWLVFFGLLLFFLTVRKKQSFKNLKFKNLKFYLKLEIRNLKFIGLTLFLILEAILFTTLILNRTTQLMPSPWQAVEWWWFVLYSTATTLLFLIILKQKNTSVICYLLSVIHLFLTFSVTAILYPLGWGFDAFVHRATETWIQNHGFIIPKQPYYIGQYSLVVWLGNLTSIPIFYIDVYLVPVLASLILPITTSSTLKKVWGLRTEYGLMALWLIPFVPFLHLHLTTPHNLVLLLTIIIVFTTLAYLKGNSPLFIPLLLGIASAATHPLLGVPMFIFVISALVLKKVSKKIKWLTIIGSISAITLSLPVLFTINNLRAGNGWPNFVNPFTKIDPFLELFQRPYWYLDNAPLIWEALYGWQLLIVPVVIAVAIGGYIMTQKRFTNYELPITIFPAASLAFILSGFLLRSWIIFPDVVSYEQDDFPLRVVKASLIFLLPFAMYTLCALFKSTKNKPVGYWLLAIGSLLLMLSLYLSYPQRNIKARFPGLNVTAADFQVVEWIHDRHSNYDYVVLSNQLVSAAALTNYSFAKYFDTPEGEIFYYSVPTGGPQYKEYGRMLYEGQKKEYMLAAMNRAGVGTGYFVVNYYWANSEKIIEGAKKTADWWKVVDDGEVWIFVYEK